MLARLDVPYRDASAGQLVWRLDGPLQPALARRRVVGVAWTLDLRLLGASHQVVLRSRARAEVGCNELVACRPDEPGRLPSTVDEHHAGLRYRFSSTVDRLPEAELGGFTDDLVRTLSAREDALVGAFPGSPHAVTAIEATADGWRTWHVYPQSAEVVATTTEIELASGGIA